MFHPRELPTCGPLPGAFQIVFHAASEDAVDAHDHLVARFDQVDHDRFHAGHSGTGNGKRQRVAGLKDLTHHFAGLVHVGDVLGVQMAERRCADGS